MTLRAMVAPASSPAKDCVSGAGGMVGGGEGVLGEVPSEVGVGTSVDACEKPTVGDPVRVGVGDGVGEGEGVGVIFPVPLLEGVLPRERVGVEVAVGVGEGVLVTEGVRVAEMLGALLAVPPPLPPPPLAEEVGEAPTFPEGEAPTARESVGARVAWEDPLPLLLPAAKLPVVVLVGGVEGEAPLRGDAVAEGVKGSDGVGGDEGEEEMEA
jgi:hypothetical protein